jgi:molecular chaperone GrpE
MNLIKKQRKDNGETGLPDGKNVLHGNSVEKEEAVKPEETPLKPESEVEGNENTQDIENGGEDAGADAKKEPTEADVLKFYLKQTLDEVKKHKNENESLKTQLSASEAQLKQSMEKLEAIIAEYDNYRRRTTAEKENLGSDATIKAVATLLPSLDNLERAMPFADSNPESFKKGVEMTLRQLLETFKSLGVEEIEAKGAEFDPELHEAVMHIEDKDVGDSIVVEVFQKGYRMGDRIVRHSVVKVAN